jgi:hypothetical protein
MDSSNSLQIAPKIRLAVIGSSGRSSPENKLLSPIHFEFAKKAVLSYIINDLKLRPFDIILVSGGSSWMDHVAVSLYLDGGFGGLRLYLPSKFDFKQKKYVNTHEGRTLNQLHAEFNTKMGSINSFEDLTKIASRGYKHNILIEIKRGFLQRNTLIAQNCDHLLAFTFDSDDFMQGGTKNTWDKTKHLNKKHFDLNIINNTSNKIINI